MSINNSVSEFEVINKIIIVDESQYIGYNFYQQLFEPEYSYYDKIGLQLLYFKENNKSIYESFGTIDKIQFYEPREASRYGISNLFLQGRSVYINITVNNNDILLFSKHSIFMTDPKPNTKRIYLLSMIKGLTLSKTKTNINTMHAHVPPSWNHGGDIMHRYNYFGTPFFYFNLANGINRQYKTDFNKLTQCSEKLFSNTASYPYGRSNKGGWQSVVNIWTDLDVLKFDNNDNNDKSCQNEFKILHDSFIEHIIKWYFSYQYGQLNYYKKYDDKQIIKSKKILVLNGGKHVQTIKSHYSINKNDTKLNDKFHFINVCLSLFFLFFLFFFFFESSVLCCGVLLHGDIALCCTCVFQNIGGCFTCLDKH